MWSAENDAKLILLTGHANQLKLPQSGISTNVVQQFKMYVGQQIDA